MYASPACGSADTSQTAQGHVIAAESRFQIWASASVVRFNGDVPSDPRPVAGTHPAQPCRHENPLRIALHTVLPPARRPAAAARPSLNFGSTQPKCNNFATRSEDLRRSVRRFVADSGASPDATPPAPVAPVGPPALPDTEPAGNRPESGSGAVGDRQNLQGLRGHITITDGGDPEVQVMLDELSLVPRELLQNLSSEGVHVYVGKGDVTGLDNNGDLVNVQPAGGAAGSTYRARYGMYRHNRREITIGTGRGMSFSRAPHEVGHAIGHVWGYNDSVELAAHLDRLRDQLPAFLLDYQDPARVRREVFAETFAVTMKDEQVARLLYDDELVDWLLQIVRDHS